MQCLVFTQKKEKEEFEKICFKRFVQRRKRRWEENGFDYQTSEAASLLENKFIHDSMNQLYDTCIYS